MSGFSKIIYKHELNIGTAKISVPIRMSYSKGKTLFSCEDYANNIHAESASFEKLIQTIEYIARGRLKIEWKSYIRVNVEGRSEFEKYLKNDPSDWITSSNDLLSVKVEIEAELIEIGIDANGAKLCRDFGNSHIRNFYDDEGFQESESDKRGIARFSDSTMTAYIDDTPENRRALLELGVKFNQLTEKLYDLLSPKEIKKTLETISSKRLLTE